MTTQAVKFRVLIKNLDGSSIWELPCEEFRFIQELNRGESATFRFERTAVQPIADIYGVTPEFIFTASYREIEIYDLNNTKIYAGYISEMQISKGRADFGNIIISSKGFFSLLEKRFCDDSLSYTNTDSSDIAWGLIDYTQNLSYGDLGITRGNDPTTKNRDRTDLRYRNIADAIRGMSAEEVKEGYDFDVSPLKVFNIYYPKGSVRDEIYLTADFNIDSYSIIKTFIDGMVNQAIVIGSGVDEANQLVEVRDSDNAYKDAFFLLQDVLSEPDVSTQVTLQDKGDLALDNYQAPRLTITIDHFYTEPLFTNYEVGDWLHVVIPEYDIDDTYRVTRRACDSEGVVTITLREF